MRFSWHFLPKLWKTNVCLISPFQSDFLFLPLEKPRYFLLLFKNDDSEKWIVGVMINYSREMIKPNQSWAFGDTAFRGNQTSSWKLRIEFPWMTRSRIVQVCLLQSVMLMDSLREYINNLPREFNGMLQ